MRVVQAFVIVLCGYVFFSCIGNTGNESQFSESNSGAELFNSDWEFVRIDSNVNALSFSGPMRKTRVPHDWSIEGEFNEDHPATYNGGALPGGIGLYKKEFELPAADSTYRFFIRFDGVYMNSRVWINEQSLGIRPNGYIGFQYDLTPHLHFGNRANTIVVRVDNSQQPNSRWYSGSGIYRNVHLIRKSHVAIDRWGVQVTTPRISDNEAIIKSSITVHNYGTENVDLRIESQLFDGDKTMAKVDSTVQITPGESNDFLQSLRLKNPELWSVETPKLYALHTRLFIADSLVDKDVTPVGIRYFNFDEKTGFSLNGKSLKIRGVCNHHDLGPLGSAINNSAIERQLDLLKGMGVNAIRTAHNPPAPELLDLCDQKGILVMDEAFDEWRKNKTTYGYGLHWDEWYKTDLTDFIKRDRNHPSVIIWSVGNEILEQWDSSGLAITRELVSIVHSLDTTRPITTGNNPPSPSNSLNASGALDLVGYNYALGAYEKHPKVFPGIPFIATETSSALATRGYYDERSDTTMRWPIRWDVRFTGGNEGNTVSSYDQVSAPWGSTHEETLKVIEKHDFMSGMFIWTGFDYLGEPTPYAWPSRSSYFGVFDLAGFPKDAYYLYKSIWTTDTVLHLFPHWTWSDRDSVDLWSYYNHADEVELFVNGKSMGKKSKSTDDMHVMWRVAYDEGEVEIKSYRDGRTVQQNIISTAAVPAAIKLEADRTSINQSAGELAFVQAYIVDENDVLIPDADNLIEFIVEDKGAVRATANGDPTNHTSFQSTERKAFHGKCLAVVEATGEKPGTIIIRARSGGINSNQLKIETIID